MFIDVRFGVPDLDSGKGYLESNTVDLARAAKQLMADHPMPAAPAPLTVSPATPDIAGQPASQAVGQPGANAPVTLESLHVEVFSTSATRDISIRKLAHPSADDGFVQLE